MGPEPPLTQLGRALNEVDELKTTVADLTRTIDTERGTTRRYRLTLVFLSVLGLLNLVGLFFAYRAADDAGTTSSTLESCLLPDGDCYRDLAERGIQGGVRGIRFQYCVLSRDPATRTAAVMDHCVQLAYPDVENIIDLVKEGQ